MKVGMLLACAALALGFAGWPSDAQITKPNPDHVQLLAPTPPMGWNSWDSFGATVEEKDIKANAKWMADHLRGFGWQYVVVDMEWFVNNPTPEGNSKTSEYTIDEFGRYTPALNRFPSAANGAGFKPLADYVHSLGLKFGIHILRGIPKQAVQENLVIAGSSFHAADAAATSDTCPWNYDNFGVVPPNLRHRPTTIRSSNSTRNGTSTLSRWIASPAPPTRATTFECSARRCASPGAPSR